MYVRDKETLILEVLNLSIQMNRLADRLKGSLFFFDQVNVFDIINKAIK